MTLSICMDYLFDEFQITCEMVHRYPGPRGFSWKFSLRKSERPTKRRLRWQRVAKRRGEKGFFFSLSSQFRNGDLFISWNWRFEHQFSFGKSVGAIRTNFHRRHECTATTDLSFVARRKIFCFCWAKRRGYSHGSMCTGSGGDTQSAPKPLMTMILSICMDYL